MLERLIVLRESHQAEEKDNSEAHRNHHHYIELGFVADIESDDKVRLSANADVAVTLEEEDSGKPVDL